VDDFLVEWDVIIFFSPNKWQTSVKEMHKKLKLTEKTIMRD